VRIFISYGRADAARVAELHDVLTDVGHDVWFDRDLGAGVRWWEAILERLRSVDLVVFVLSPDSAKSRACRYEVEYADALGRAIIPIMVRDTEIEYAPGGIPARNVMPFATPEGRDWARLMTSVQQTPAGTPLPEPLPDPPPAPMADVPMLSAAQQEVLQQAIMLKLPDNPTTAEIADYVGDQIAGLAPATGPGGWAQWIVQRILEHENAELFERSMSFLDGHTDRLGELVAVAATFKAYPSSWRPLRSGGGTIDWSLEADPLFVRSGRPFLDREPFRRLLPRLGKTIDTPTCTVIQGSRGIGKSYLHQYLEKVAAEWRIPGSTGGDADRTLLRVGVSEFPESSTNMETDIPAFHLSNGLGIRTAAPRRHEGDERYAQNLAAWIAHDTPTGELPAIAIFDGYGHENVPKPIKTFIEQLVEIVQADADTSGRLRVMLCDYDVGRLARRNLAYTQLVLRPLSDVEIGRWLKRRHPNLPDFRYDDATAVIRNRLGANPTTDSLCVLVERTSLEIEGQS
jgi:hypothetical protein